MKDTLLRLSDLVAGDEITILSLSEMKERSKGSPGASLFFQQDIPSGWGLSRKDCEKLFGTTQVIKTIVDGKIHIYGHPQKIDVKQIKSVNKQQQRYVWKAEKDGYGHPVSVYYDVHNARHVSTSENPTIEDINYPFYPIDTIVKILQYDFRGVIARVTKTADTTVLVDSLMTGSEILLNKWEIETYKPKFEIYDVVKFDIFDKNAKYFVHGHENLTIKKVLSSGAYLVEERVHGENWSVFEEELILQTDELEDKVIIDEAIMWKNPRPKKSNKKAISVGDLVLVDGLEPLRPVIKVTPKTCTVEISSDKTKRVNLTSVFPSYQQQDTKIVKVGNIIDVKDHKFLMIVSAVGAAGIITTNKNVLKLESITRVYSSEQQTKSCELYECGRVISGEQEYNSVEAFKLDNPTFLHEVKEVHHTIDHINISKHYSIDVELIKPKEVNISKILKTTLDHPLNVLKRRWALLVGESGTGKTEIAVDYCKKQNKKYVKLQGTAQLTVDDVIGYKSLTTGKYITSLLRQAVEFGHTFILDEIDACNPNTLLVLNGLKQEKFQFPDELITVHKDFRFIGTANTLEYSEEYNARAPMDKATKARFKIIEYNMKPHELALRYGLNNVKEIKNIERLTPREVEGIVLDKQIEALEASEQTKG